MIKFLSIKCSKEEINIQLLFFIHITIKNLFYNIYNFIKFYYYRLKYHFISRNNYIHIKNTNTNSDVLIIELNEDGHSELFASDVNYFQELGYNKIDLICHPNIKNENPLYLYDKNKLPNIFAINQYYVHKLMKENYFKKYKYIFINSLIYYKIIDSDHKEEKNLLNEFIDNKNKFNNDFKILSYAHSKFLKCKNDYDSSNVFVLYDYLTRDTNFTSLSPIYFTNNIKKQKKDKIVFSVFGWVIEECRNYKLLFEVFEKLIKNNINNFELYIVGTYNSSYCGDFKNKYGKKLYKKYKKYKNIHFTGRASNNEMYNIALQTDYVLFLLDSKLEKHLDYISKKASGTIGLTLGFNMIPIIEKDFADVYGFNNDNAIIYKNNDLYNAMLTAINNSKDQYSKMEIALSKMQKEIMDKSKQNLLNALKK